MLWFFSLEIYKQEWLLDMAKQDKFFDTLLNEISPMRINIKFPFWGGVGSYKPHVLRRDTSIDRVFLASIRRMAQDTDFHLKVELCPRFGRKNNALTFLHELIHLWQDMNGFFIIPFQKWKGAPLMLDARSFIQTVLICEACAAVGAIDAAYRLKQKGRVEAWQGALASKDWKELTKYYQDELNAGFDKTEVCSRTFVKWFESPQRSYYEERGAQIYQVLMRPYLKKITAQDFRKLELSAYIEGLPLSGSPFLWLKEVDFRHQTFISIENTKAKNFVKRQEDKFGICINNAFCDIEIGSLPYIVKQSFK